MIYAGEENLTEANCTSQDFIDVELDNILRGIYKTWNL